MIIDIHNSQLDVIIDPKPVGQHGYDFGQKRSHTIAMWSEGKSLLGRAVKSVTSAWLGMGTTWAMGIRSGSTKM